LKGSPKGGKRGVAVAITRQRLVLRYYLRGLGPEQIARQPDIRAAPATIYRDIQALQVNIAKKVEAAKLWPIKRHFLLQEELMREVWGIFHRPKEKHLVGSGENQREIELDDSFRKLFSIDRLHKISTDLAKLAFPQVPELSQPAGPVLDPVKVVVALMEGLPFEQREKAITILRKQVVQETAPRIS
jgi:hypothetical protein